MEIPFTPEKLAERWSCSASKVRTMIRKGQLQAFRVGRKLPRISVEEVQRFEREGGCQTIASEGSKGNSSSSGTKAADAAAIALARVTRRSLASQSESLSDSANGSELPKPANSPSVLAALVLRYIAERRKAAGDGTIHTELGYLRAATALAHRRGLVTVCPEIDLPPKPRPRTAHLTAPQALSLIDAAISPHVRLFIQLALYTAGRPSAILDLTWDRVDFEAKVIRLDNPARDRTPKGRATVPMAEAMIEPLLEAKRSAVSAYVVEFGGGKVANIKKEIKLTAARAGLTGVTPYVLRHTAAVLLAQAGVPISEISQYLGHTTVLQGPANQSYGSIARKTAK